MCRMNVSNTRELEQIKIQLNAFKAISLNDLSNVSLMNRVDTKFVGPASLIPQVLNALNDDYKVLEIDSDRYFQYKTQYYDTAEYGMYEAHQNGKLNRYKVRKREYVSSGQLFLEVKFKNNKRRTIKKRVERKENNALTSSELEFLNENTPFNSNALEHKLSNAFNRITLAGQMERVTIDFGLSFSDNDGFSKDFHDIVIFELKQAKYSPTSKAMIALKKFKIKQQSFSKYCLGAASLNTHIKSNRMKQKFEMIDKIKAEIKP